MCGIAINRLNLTPFEFYQLVPAEFHYALEDYESTQFTPMKRTCEMLRLVAAKVHNSAFGIQEKDQVRNPSQIIRFSWEDKPRIQTVEEMRAIILGLSDTPGVKVTQKGKPVKLEESDGSK